MNVRLYILQRASALIMAPLVLIHLAVIFYATNRGLSAREILGRTHGSALWAGFYSLFVLAAALHASIGVRVIAAEWTRLERLPLAILGWAVGLLLAALGLLAVAAVVLA